MKLALKRQNEETKKQEDVVIEIKKISPLPIPRHLLLVRVSNYPSTLDENLIENNHYEIFTVLYLGLATAKIGNTILALVAQFIGDGGDIDIRVLSDLPTGYSQCDESEHFLIDYEGYENICKMTGAKKRTIIEYIEQFYLNCETIGINSIIIKEHEALNIDQYKFTPLAGFDMRKSNYKPT